MKMAYAASSRILLLLPGSAKSTFSKARSLRNVTSTSLLARNRWCTTAFALTSCKQLNVTNTWLMLEITDRMTAVRINSSAENILHRRISWINQCYLFTHFAVSYSPKVKKLHQFRTLHSIHSHYYSHSDTTNHTNQICQSVKFFNAR